MSCFCGTICNRIPLRTQAKMAPRWEADGVFLGKLDLSDEVIVGPSKGIETTRSFTTNEGRSTMESRDSADVCRGTVAPAGPHD